MPAFAPFRPTARPPCRLVAKHLIFHSQNNAGRVDMAIEIIGISAAFQSEKTGSTPVGSAMNYFHFSSRFPILILCLASYSDFRSCFVRLDEIAPLARSALALNFG